MTEKEIAALDRDEQRHFYRCAECGEFVDKRQLDEVLFHEDHKPRPDIQYAGSGLIRPSQPEKIICPVCGAECVQRSCKVVCESACCRGRVVLNCSEF